MIMKLNSIALAAALGLLVASSACTQKKGDETAKQTSFDKKPTSNTPDKKDGAFISSIETGDYIMKLHNAFVYTSHTTNAVVTNVKPKEGFRFVYLDVSLTNKSSGPIDGGSLFISMKVTDDKGTEYKKPAMALALYRTENTGAEEREEYKALWETFKPGDMHRAIVYAVEVPAHINDFIISLPTDRKRKEWNTARFSI